MTLQNILDQNETGAAEAVPETTTINGSRRLTVAKTFQLMQTMANAVEQIASHYRDIPQAKPADLDMSLDQMAKSAAAIQKVCAELKAGNR